MRRRIGLIALVAVPAALIAIGAAAGWFTRHELHDVEDYSWARSLEREPR